MVHLASGDRDYLGGNEKTVTDLDNPAGVQAGPSTEEMRIFGEADTLQGEDSGGLGVQPPSEEPRVEPRRVPTETAVTQSESQAYGTLIAIGVVILVIAIFSLKDSFTSSTSASALSEEEWLAENATESEKMIFDEDEAEDFELVEEEFVVEEEMVTAWMLWGEYEPTDYILESRLRRIDVFAEEEPQRFDPGDPGVLAVLDLPDRPAVEKKPKRRIKRTIKRKKRVERPKKSRKKENRKKKAEDLKRIDKMIPNF